MKNVSGWYSSPLHPLLLCSLGVDLNWTFFRFFVLFYVYQIPSRHVYMVANIKKVASIQKSNPSVNSNQPLSVY